MPFVPQSDGRAYAVFPALKKDPVPLRQSGKLYTKQSGPGVELFYQNDLGDVTQLTPAGILDETVTVYIDAGAGNDANDGLTSGAAIQSWARLNEIRGQYKIQTAPFIIRNIGTVDLVVGPLAPLIAAGPDASTVIYCSEMTVVAAGFLTGPTSNRNIPINAFPTIDQARGYTLKIGNKYRTVLSNTAVEVVASLSFGALLAGAAFTLLEPTSRLIVNPATPGAFQKVPLWQDVGLSPQQSPLILCNVRFGSNEVGTNIDCSGSAIFALGMTVSSSIGFAMDSGTLSLGASVGSFRSFFIGNEITLAWMQAYLPELGFTTANDYEGWGFASLDPIGTFGNGLQFFGDAISVGYGALEYHFPGGASIMDFLAASVKTSFDVSGTGWHNFNFLKATQLGSPCSQSGTCFLSVFSGTVNDIEGFGLNISSPESNAEVRGTWRGQINATSGSVRLVNFTGISGTALRVTGGKAVISGTSVLTGSSGYAVQVDAGDLFVASAPGANWTGAINAILAAGVAHPNADLAASFSAIIEGGARLARTT